MINANRLKKLCILSFPQHVIHKIAFTRLPWPRHHQAPTPASSLPWWSSSSSSPSSSSPWCTRGSTTTTSGSCTSATSARWRNQGRKSTPSTRRTNDFADSSLRITEVKSRWQEEVSEPFLDPIFCELEKKQADIFTITCPRAARLTHFWWEG